MNCTANWNHAMLFPFIAFFLSLTTLISCYKQFLPAIVRHTTILLINLSFTCELCPVKLGLNNLSMISNTESICRSMHFEKKNIVHAIKKPRNCTNLLSILKCEEHTSEHIHLFARQSHNFQRILCSTLSKTALNYGLCAKTHL